MADAVTEDARSGTLFVRPAAVLGAASGEGSFVVLGVDR